MLIRLRKYDDFIEGLRVLTTSTSTRCFWEAVLEVSQTVATDKAIMAVIDGKIAKATDMTLVSDLFVVDDQEKLRARFRERRAKWEIIKATLVAMCVAADIKVSNLPSGFGVFRELDAAVSYSIAVVAAPDVPFDEESVETPKQFCLVATEPASQLQSPDLCSLWFDGWTPTQPVIEFVQGTLQKIVACCNGCFQSDVIKFLGEGAEQLLKDIVNGSVTMPVQSFGKVVRLPDAVVADLRTCIQILGAQAQIKFGDTEVPILLAGAGPFVKSIMALHGQALDEKIAFDVVVPNVSLFADTVWRMSGFLSIDGQLSEKAKKLEQDMVSCLRNAILAIAGRSQASVQAALTDLKTKSSADAVDPVKHLSKEPVDAKALENFHKTAAAKAFAKAHSAAETASTKHDDVMTNLKATKAVQDLFKPADWVDIDKLLNAVLDDGTKKDQVMMSAAKAAANFTIVQASFGPLGKHTRAGLKEIANERLSSLGVNTSTDIHAAVAALMQ